MPVQHKTSFIQLNSTSLLFPVLSAVCSFHHCCCCQLSSKPVFTYECLSKIGLVTLKQDSQNKFWLRLNRFLLILFQCYSSYFLQSEQTTVSTKSNHGSSVLLSWENYALVIIMTDIYALVQKKNHHLHHLFCNAKDHPLRAVLRIFAKSIKHH